MRDKIKKAAYDRIRNEGKKESIAEQKKKYYKENRNELCESHSIYRKENKDKRSEYAKKYYVENKDEVNKRVKKYKDNNKDKVSEYKKDYYKKNRARIRDKQNIYRKTQFETNIVYRMKRKIGKNLRSSIKNGGYTKKSRTHDVIGCEYKYLIEYLEFLFEPWMNWDNYGKYNGELNYGWDIDHITPLSTANTDEELLRLWHYTNLQPLCSYVNRYVKRNKIVSQQ